MKKEGKQQVWKEYQKDIAEDNYYYLRSCIRQNFFPAAENLYINILRDLLGKDVFDFIPFELIKSRKKIAELVSKLKHPISFEEVHKINTYYITICPVLNSKKEIINLIEKRILGLDESNSEEIKTKLIRSFSAG